MKQRLSATEKTVDLGELVLDRARALREQIKARRKGDPMPTPEAMLFEARELRVRELGDLS